MTDTVWREMQVNAILKLVKEHRETCMGNCDIVLYSLRPIVEQLLERELTIEESKLFI